MSLITGRIYRIICYSDPSINYIGSTFDTLRNRWQRHKAHYKARRNNLSIYSYFDKIGIDNFKILLIKEYKVVDKSHLRAYEQLWINKTNCVNTQSAFCIKYLSARLYKKSQKFKEAVKKREIKKYLEERRNLGILEYRCECGTFLLWENKARHERTAKHIKLLAAKQS